MHEDKVFGYKERQTNFATRVVGQIAIAAWLTLMICLPWSGPVWCTVTKGFTIVAIFILSMVWLMITIEDAT